MKEAVLNVDLDSILYNYRHLKCYYQKNIIAVLKDNAYGVGLLEVANTLKNEEGLIIAVNNFNDVKLLKQNNILIPILYLNVFDKNDLEFIKDNNISVVVESLEQLKLIKNTNIKFHLKFNTGMNRLGLNEKDSIKAINEINNNDKYNLEGLMTHFANDDKDHISYKKFEEFVKKVNKKNLKIHCFASSSTNEKFDDISNYLRIGLKLYGIGERNSFLHNALTLKAPIISIKEITKNQFVGYDLSYQTHENGYLYLLPLGYGQGWGRFNTSMAFVNNFYMNQAGKISMDYSSYFSKYYYKNTDSVELFGKNIPLQSLAYINKMTPHEILVKLKVKKEYTKINI